MSSGPAHPEGRADGAAVDPATRPHPRLVAVQVSDQPGTKEVRAKVAPRPWSLYLSGHRSVDQALEAAADALHVYRHTGVWDGGVQLSLAMKVLAESLEPLVRAHEP